MEKGLAWSACLIAAAGTTAIAMIGFSTWRYDVALDRAAAALSARTGTAAAAELSVTFWQERQAIDAYMAAPGTAALGAVTSRHDRFQRLASQLGASSPGAGAPSRAQAVAANAHYYALFTRARGVAGTASGPEHVAVAGLEAAAAAVEPPLGALDHHLTLRAAAAHSAAAAVMRQARWIGIAALLIRIALGNALGSFMLRLLGRALPRA